MTQEQFDILIQKLDEIRKEVVEKLEQIRWQGIDIENALKGIEKK